jgi:hypothetical protein
VVVGPEDLVDEPQAFRNINDPEVRQQLVDQVAALGGERGARLWIVSATSGERLAEHALVSPPVWDGVAAVAGKLYMATQDGRLVCLAGAR